MQNIMHHVPLFSKNQAGFTQFSTFFSLRINTVFSY